MKASDFKQETIVDLGDGIKVEHFGRSYIVTSEKDGPAGFYYLDTLTFNSVKAAVRFLRRKANATKDAKS